MKPLILCLLAFVAPAFAIDYDNYSEVYQKTGDSYLLLFESSVRPDILIGYLSEAAEVLNKAKQYGEIDPARVARLRRYVAYLKADPVSARSEDYADLMQELDGEMAKLGR